MSISNGQYIQQLYNMAARITDFSIDAIMGNNIGLNDPSRFLMPNQDLRPIDLTCHLVHHSNHHYDEVDSEHLEEIDVVNIDYSNHRQELQVVNSSTITCTSLADGDEDEEKDKFEFNSIQDKQVSRKPRPKKYQCPYCWVALSNTGQFRGHIRIHTGERPFKCDHPFCEKTFTRNEELTRHKRIHTGQRPYACHLCNKHFGRKDHLKKHTRTHENERTCRNVIRDQVR